VAYGKGLSLEQFNRNGEIITRPEGPTFDAYVAGQAETWLDLVARKGPPFMGVVSLQHVAAKMNRLQHGCINGHSEDARLASSMLDTLRQLTYCETRCYRLRTTRQRLLRG
jgi:hypothetical protein